MKLQIKMNKVYLECCNVICKLLLVLTDCVCTGFCCICNGEPWEFTRGEGATACSWGICVNFLRIYEHFLHIWSCMDAISFCLWSKELRILWKPCLSVHFHDKVSATKLFVGFSWNLVYEIFLNSCPADASFLKSTQWCKWISAYTVHILVPVWVYTVGSHFMTELRSRIFGCKSNRHKTSTI